MNQENTPNPLPPFEDGKLIDRMAIDKPNEQGMYPFDVIRDAQIRKLEKELEVPESEY